MGLPPYSTGAPVRLRSVCAMTAPARTTELPRRAPTFEPHVTHTDLLVTLGGFLAATAVGGAGLTLLIRGGVDPTTAATGGIPTTVALWFVALWYGLRARGWGWADLGLGGRPMVGRWLWQVVLAYASVIVLATLLVSVLSAPGEQPDLLAGGLRFGPAAVLAIVLAVVLVGPLVEEVVFRRILLGWLEARVGVVVAAVGQAALFAVLHVVPAAMVLTFLLGLAAAFLARRHRSLWPALALHVLNNLVAVMVVVTMLG